MTSMIFPTRRDETWRYSDIAALATLWPLPAPTCIDVAAGETARCHLLQDAADDATAVHDYVIAIADGARFE